MTKASTAVPQKTKPDPCPMAYPSGTLIAPKDVAEILTTSLKTVHEMVNDGRLPGYKFSDKPGSSIRVKVDDVYAMLVPVVPKDVLEEARSRQPGPLHQPIPSSGGKS